MLAIDRSGNKLLDFIKIALLRDISSDEEIRELDRKLTEFY